MGIAGAFMLCFTAALAVPPFLAALGAPKYIAALVILRESSGRYREHRREGKFSQHYTVTVELGADLAGNHICILAGLFEELQPFVAQTFVFATSEFESLVHLLTAIEKHPAHKHLIKALEERQHVSQDSPTKAIDEEIAWRAHQLRPAIRPLADYLDNHDRGRVVSAA